jgi:acetolactate synthase-1/2/3 large subunit
MIKEQQKAAFGAKGVVGTEMPDRSYEKLAGVFGGYGERVTRPDQLRGALERAFGAGVPAILNVDTRTDPSPELQWMLRPKR